MGIDIFAVSVPIKRPSSMIGNLALQDPALEPTGQGFHVLTLTPFYPTTQDDAQGCFVAEPLPLISKLGVVNTVMAVQPFYRPYTVANGRVFPARQARFISLPGGFGLPTAGAFLFAQLLGRVRRLHRFKPIHVIHAHAALPCGHAAALLGRELRIPFAVTVHGLDAYSTSQVAGRPGKWCKHVSRFVYASASCVICISEKVRDRVLELARGRVKTEVVYNGVDPDEFHPSSESPKVNTILCVGNLIPTKGQDILIKAFAAVCASFPESSCEFIGDGADKSRLARTAKELNLDEKIRFVGRRTRGEVADAMRRCTVFALPSGYEGLGCVYLEAMATGKATIGCRGQGIEEIIEHGANGWLVNPGDVKDLAHAFSELLPNPMLRNEIGNAARRTILQGFTLAHQAERLARIYRECAE
jgi:teichuronic acid biosynthesis glycosyltransferase TuaC